VDLHVCLYCTALSNDDIAVTTTDVIACLKFLLIFCSVLVANNEQCPFKTVKSNQEACFSSSFPREFYKDSIDEICKYVTVSFLCCFKSCILYRYL